MNLHALPGVDLYLTVSAGQYQESNVILQECLSNVERPEDKAVVLRLRSRNHWLRSEFSEALNDTLLALHVLNVEINSSPTRRQADVMFEAMKNEILAVGFEDILAIPRTTDPRIELAVALLNDAGL